MTGLYVHIPFCSVKCFYCDFTAFSGQGKLARRYLAALEAEARLGGAASPGTLYVGGGTPSELSAEETRELYALLGRAYPQARFSESTFEANPDSLDADKLAVLRAAGVTRLSIGLQTADDAQLKAIGRRHGFSDFVDGFRLARRLGGLDLCVDLMYGLPGQTLASWRATLESVLALGPDHLSLYGLQVEDRTLFAKRAVENDEVLEREMYELALDLARAAGLVHYELSNFARPGHESRHNLNYWDDGEYLGLGCGAASHLGGARSTNLDRLTEYLKAVEAGRRPAAESERLSGLAKLGEKAFLGLRRVDGFEPGPELEAAFAPAWSRLERDGLVARAGARRRLTREGLFLANVAFSHFVPPFQTADMGGS